MQIEHWTDNALDKRYLIGRFEKKTFTSRNVELLQMH